ncbi:hypothetical protein ACIBFB_09815 [Nocardiopsis sp. NPDC050513]|uniref:hypothetical protein n=1 Tax=Nocardiopsis sp. NPDC050513 TaxID=3364338 RepID=UPI0037B773C0
MDSRGRIGPGTDPAVGLLERLRGSDAAASILPRLPYDFDLGRDWAADDWPLELASGESLTGVASSGGGDAFLLCGGDERRPLIHYDGASGMTVLGRDLAESLELVLGVPCRWDVMWALERGGRDAALAAYEESMADLAADHAEEPEDGIDVVAAYEEAAGELGLRVLPGAELIDRWARSAAVLGPALTLLWVEEPQAPVVVGGRYPRAVGPAGSRV